LTAYLKGEVVDHITGRVKYTTYTKQIRSDGSVRYDMEYEDIINESEYNFTDISSEEWREYDFGGVEVRIDNPIGLAVGENGHRIVDTNGVSHYVGYDGFYFSWESGEGEPHFVK